MSVEKSEAIVVMGATGLQGRAVTRHLLGNGWRVRAVSRNPASEQAQALLALGAELFRGDMAHPESLVPIFQGAYGVFSVQNPMISGVEDEVRQGKNVADVARQSNIQHVVYGSAGIGRKGTGIPSWESKLVVEDYMKALGLPLTILRPMAFMELMTEKKFFPPISTWQVMPKLMGSSRKLVWLSTDDLGYIVAKVFSDPDTFTGKDLQLASDVQSIDDCRAIYREVMGKNPARFPMPVWMFERYGFVGKDLTVMWRWLRTGDLDLNIEETLALHPDASSVRSWLQDQKRARGAW
jgi:uncharacterized protein YbjT (DUF2867 family)